MRCKTRGFVLIIVLFFLFVMTYVALSGAETIILSNKMQASTQQESALFYRALAGLKQMISVEEGVPVTLPYSSIDLKTSQKMLSQDHCGNQTVTMQSIAQRGNDSVILNSEDIFAKVPMIAGCPPLLRHRRLWLSEE